MPYYDVANVVTGTKTNMIDQMPCGYGTLRNHYCKNPVPSLLLTGAEESAAPNVTCSPAKRFELHSKSSTDLHRCLSCSKIWVSYQSSIVASWMLIHNCRCFQTHLRMLLQSLRAHCLALGGPGSIWKYLAALVRSTTVFKRFLNGFRTDLHFANVRRWFLDDGRLKYCIHQTVLSDGLGVHANPMYITHNCKTTYNTQNRKQTQMRQKYLQPF